MHRQQSNNGNSIRDARGPRTGFRRHRFGIDSNHVPMDRYMAILDRHNGTRYDFHCGSGNDRYTDQRLSPEEVLRVTIVDEDTLERVSYTLNQTFHFPMRELMYTFAEQVGVRIDQLEFRHSDNKLIPLDATSTTIGLSSNEENIIAVKVLKTNWENRVEMFTRLNRMGKVTVQPVGGNYGTDDKNNKVFGNIDLLPKIFDYCNLQSLVNCAQVCRFWFHVTQRFSVLLQLQDGDACCWQDQQHYPSLLHDGCRHSFNLSLCHAKTKHNWNKINIQKESTDNQGYGFCKAAGCVVVKTVMMDSITRKLQSKWHALDNSKTEFMRSIQRHGQLVASSHYMNLSSSSSLPQQEIPPPGEQGDGFIAEARDIKYKNCAVELYRRYFSPDMHYIFPLIVDKQAAVGLDFTTTNTTLIFGGNNSSRPTPNWARERMRQALGSTRNHDDGLRRTPIGSVSWRIHDSKEQIVKAGISGGGGTTNKNFAANSNIDPQEDITVLHGWKPQLILEVLFIAVWESDRGGEYGSSLVASLQSKLVEYALSHGYKSALLYVEIGHEQPKAKQFWGNNGFLKVAEATEESPTADQQPQSNGMMKEGLLAPPIEFQSDNDQLFESLKPYELSFIDRCCLRFKDTAQYAKRIIV